MHILEKKYTPIRITTLIICIYKKKNQLQKQYKSIKNQLISLGIWNLMLKQKFII